LTYYHLLITSLIIIIVLPCVTLCKCIRNARHARRKFNRNRRIKIDKLIDNIVNDSIITYEIKYKKVHLSKKI